MADRQYEEKLARAIYARDRAQYLRNGISEAAFVESHLITAGLAELEAGTAASDQSDKGAPDAHQWLISNLDAAGRTG